HLEGGPNVSIKVGQTGLSKASPQPSAVSQDARYRQLEVVVKDRTRHPAEELEADVVPFTERFAALRRIGLYQAGVAVRQVHREKMDLLLHPADHRQRFAEVDLRVPWFVPQRHEHLTLPLAALVHVVLYDRDPAGISVLVPQPLEDPLRGMLLLGWLPLIFLQDPVDDPDEWIQLRPRRWLAPPVSRRHRERQHLRHRPRVDPEPTCRLPPTHPLHIHRSPHLPVQFHAFHPSALCPSWQKTFSCRTFAPALRPVYQAASLRDFFTGALNIWGYWKQHELPNFCPHDFAQLSFAARRALKRMRRRPSLLMAFWEQAELFPL